MKIGILGGGLGGLSTAIALKQKGGHVEVYERHDRPTEIGAGIVCWPNATFVLEQLGVLNDIAACAGAIEGMKRLSWSGEALGQMDVNVLNAQMSFPSYSILRKDLLNILTQRAKALGIKIHYAHNVQSIQREQGKASVYFDNGLNIQPDIVIGADGRMNSHSRRYVHGDNRPIYQGFINWIGVYEGDVSLFDELSVLDFWGVGDRFGIVPVSKTKAYWAGGTVAKNIDALTPENYKAELQALFGEWANPISQVIAGTPKEKINKVYVHDHNPIEVWHKDNLLLIGDSVHAPLPTSGQGACQAFEDAWHLANVLDDNTASLQQAFSRFTELRYTKTSGIITAGRQIASAIFNRDVEYCQQRDRDSKTTNFNDVAIAMAGGWGAGLPIGV